MSSFQRSALQVFLVAFTDAPSPSGTISSRNVRRIGAYPERVVDKGEAEALARANFCGRAREGSNDCWRWGLETRQERRSESNNEDEDIESEDGTTRNATSERGKPGSWRLYVRPYFLSLSTNGPHRMRAGNAGKWGGDTLQVPSSLHPATSSLARRRSTSYGIISRPLIQSHPQHSNIASCQGISILRGPDITKARESTMRRPRRTHAWAYDLLGVPTLGGQG